MAPAAFSMPAYFPVWERFGRLQQLDRDIERLEDDLDNARFGSPEWSSTGSDLTALRQEQAFLERELRSSFEINFGTDIWSFVGRLG